ncbi:DUF45 domain-containing protein [Saccharibacter sp. 17.LH.SD]|uniref:M48 family metallopeptidase n=1 Tax=Saccharibacter sp. 17.LH.SD TaxID=2689393 RepID=UPI00136BB261|nr:SprT family zinc-dependent metalloprotease [Saccharibacter sp. 17.LH.SD]MXV44280.1 DUF45 domain-containing protein [Saccharibacter sp. 17.LH.SD]
MERVLFYGGEPIRITLIPCTRLRTKLRIKVQPDLSVQVIVPEGTSEVDLEHALRQKTRWIWQKLQGFKSVQEHVIPRDYVSGESHFYLWRRHVLKIYHLPDAPERVRMFRSQIEISVQKRHALRIQKLLELWYFTRAQEVFRARLNVFLPSMRWVIRSPELKLQVMRMQWGNCSPEGDIITLNPYLVKAPRDCIDYVILHEMCHLKEHNHGPGFWQLLGYVMPDWKRHKARLDEMAELLLGSHSFLR